MRNLRLRRFVAGTLALIMFNMNIFSYGEVIEELSSIIHEDETTNSATENKGCQTKHNWDEGEVTAEATCTGKGEITYTCIDCEETKTEEIDMLDHDWDEGNTTTEPTCTDKGEITYTCTDCEETKTEEIDMLGHDWDEGEITIQPTCTTVGEMTYTCADCTTTKTEKIDMLEHNWDEGTVTVEATCTVIGEKVYTCADCTTTKAEEIDMLEHNWDEGNTTTEPTCTDKGEITYTCTDCEETKTEEIDMLDHNWDEGTTTVEATCTVAGEKVYTCADCTTTKTEEIDMLDHNWDEGTTTVEATCTTEGEKVYTCSDCTTTKTETINMLAHNWNEGEVTTEPTEETAGEKTYTCNVCLVTKTEELPKINVGDGALDIPQQTPGEPTVGDGALDIPQTEPEVTEPETPYLVIDPNGSTEYIEMGEIINIITNFDEGTAVSFAWRETNEITEDIYWTELVGNELEFEPYGEETYLFIKGIKNGEEIITVSNAYMFDVEAFMQAWDVSTYDYVESTTLTISTPTIEYKEEIDSKEATVSFTISSSTTTAKTLKIYDSSSNEVNVQFTGFNETKSGSQNITAVITAIGTYTIELIDETGYKRQNFTISENTTILLEVDNSPKVGYFLGDTSDISAGTLKYGTTFKTTASGISMEDARVTVGNIDTSTTGTKTISVLYNDGTLELSTSFKVEVTDGCVIFTPNGSEDYMEAEEPIGVLTDFDIGTLVYYAWGMSKDSSKFTNEDWKPLTKPEVGLVPKGPDNYLFVKGIKNGNEKIEVSEKYKFYAPMIGMEIISVPARTIYNEGTTTLTAQDYAGLVLNFTYDIGQDEPGRKEVRYEDFTTNSIEYSTSISGIIGVEKLTISHTDKVSGKTFTDSFYITINSTSHPNTLVNSPEVAEGMLPVKWIEAEQKWMITTAEDSNWYDYTSGINQWANIMLKDDLVLQKYDEIGGTQEELAGKIVEEMGSMFVWIPRYNAAFDSNGKISGITDFVKNNPNADMQSKTSDGGNGTGDPVAYTEIEWVDTDEDALPAFTFGTGVELAGFWMAKFEASNNGQYAKIVPGVAPAAGVKLVDAVSASTAIMGTNKVYYGVEQAVIDSHLIRNSEWAAVAFLTNATTDGGVTYTGDIPYINNSQKTGYAAKNLNSGTSYPYNYKDEKEGIEQNGSTTHNIYGVYDMSGGRAEYVAAYFYQGQLEDEVDGIDTSSESHWDNLTTLADNDSSNDVLGHAMKEISRSDLTVSGEGTGAVVNNNILPRDDTRIKLIDADTGYIPEEDYYEPIILRGGNYNSGEGAGIFTFSSDFMERVEYGYRPVIVLAKGVESKPLQINMTLVSNNANFPTQAKIGDKITATITSNKSINITDDMVTITVGGEPVKGTWVKTGDFGNWTIEYTFIDTDKSGWVEVIISDIINETEDLVNDENNQVLFTNGDVAGEEESEKPLDLTHTPTAPTNGAVTIEITTREDLTIIEKKYVSLKELTDNGVSITDESIKEYISENGKLISGNEFDVTKNDTYYVVVTDQAGNKYIDNEVIGNIDLTIPTLKITNYDTDNTSHANFAKNGDTVTVEMESSKEIYTIPAVTIGGREADTVVWTNGTTTGYATYTIPSDEEDLVEGLLTVSISGYVDIAGNNGDPVTATADEAGNTVTYDRTQVKPTIVLKTSNTYTKQNNEIYYEVTFSDTNFDEDKLDMTADDFEIVVTSGEITNHVITVAAGDNKVYVKEIEGEGTFNLKLLGVNAAGHTPADDMAGNKTAELESSDIIYVDTVQPSFTVNPDYDEPEDALISIESDSTYTVEEKTTYAKNGDTIILTLKAREEVTTPTVTIMGRTATVTTTDNRIFTATYQIPVDEIDLQEGQVRFEISNYDELDTKFNNPGKTHSEVTDGTKVIYDRTKPSIVLNPNENLAYKNTHTTEVTVTDLPAGLKSVTLEYAWTENNTDIPAAWDGTVELSNGKATIEGNGYTGTYYLWIKELSDKAGNVNSLTSGKFNFDNAEPEINSISISSNNANPSNATVGNIVTVTMTATEPIYTPPTVTIGGFTATVNWVAGAQTGTASVTCNESFPEGELAINISGYRDIANNVGETKDSTTDGSKVIFDKAAPTIETIIIESNNETNNKYATNGDTITVTMTASEAIYTAPTVTIGGRNADIDWDTTNGALTGTATYTIPSDETSLLEGLLAVSISGYKDVTNNVGETVTDISKGVLSVTYDRTNPTGLISAPSKPEINESSDREVTYTITYSDINFNASTLSVSDITLNTTGDVTADVAVGAGTGNTRTVTLSNIAGTGTIGISVAAGTAKDKAGLLVAALGPSELVKVDTKKPVVTITEVKSDNTNPIYAKNGDTITAKFAADEKITTPVVTVAGRIATVVTTDNINFTAIYKIPTDESTFVEGQDMVVVVAGYKDMNLTESNTNVDVTETGKVTYVNNPPTITSVTVETNNTTNNKYATNGDTITVTMISSEEIYTKPVVAIVDKTGTIIREFENVSWSNGATTGTATYTIDSTENILTEGLLTVVINGFKNISGVPGIEKRITEITYDRTSPVITLTPNGETTSKNSHTVEVKITDNIAGLNSNTIEYAWSTSNSVTPASWTNGTLTNEKITVTGSGYNGTYYLWINTLKDKAGNTNAHVSDEFVFDNINPGLDKDGENNDKVQFVSNNSTNTSYATNGNTLILTFTTNEEVNIVSGTIAGRVATVQTTDNKSFTLTYEIPANENVLAQGNVGYEVSFKDAAGNTTTISGDGIEYDRTNPTITFNPNGDTTYKTEHSATVTVEDANSGLLTTTFKYAWSTSNITVPTFTETFTNGGTITGAGFTGTYYLWIQQVSDKAGNVTGPVVSNAFNFDNEKPISIEIIGENNIDIPDSEIEGVKLTGKATDNTKIQYYKWTTSEATPTSDWTTVANPTNDVSAAYGSNITTAGTYYFHVKDIAGNTWYASKTIYSVAYNANGGTGAPEAQYKVDGVDLKLSSTEPTNTGYTFRGWKIGEKIYQAGSIFAQNESVTLEAQWEEEQLTVHFDAVTNGGIASFTSKTVVYGGTYGELPIAVKEGWTFTGWYTEGEGGTRIGTDSDDLTDGSGTTVEITADQTVYAQFIKNTYTVTYNSNKPTNASATVSGSTDNSTHTYDVASSLTTNGYSLTGWTFDGWNTIENGTGTKYADNASVINLTTVAGATVTLYAQWKQNTYQVKYDANGGSGSMSNSIHTYDLPSNLSKNLFTKTGYIFIGWNTDKNAETAIYNEQELITTLTTVNNDIVELFAIWMESTVVLTVNHKLQNADDDDEYTLYKSEIKPAITGTLIDLADYAISEGDLVYADFKEELSTTTHTTVQADGSTVVTLKYTRKTYTLTLEKGAYIETVTGAGTYRWGQNIEISATLAANEAGYTNKWLNWTSSNTGLIPELSAQIVTIMMPKGDITLTANGTRTPNTYKVNFDATTNGGTLVGASSKFVTFDAPVGDMPTATKTVEGYTVTFDGWYTSTGIKVTPTTIVDSSLLAEILKTEVDGEDEVTLYAQFTQTPAMVKYTVNHRLIDANPTLIAGGEHYDRPIYKTEIKYANTGTIITLANEVNFDGDLEYTTYGRGSLSCKVHKVVDGVCEGCRMLEDENPDLTTVKVDIANINGEIYGDVNGDRKVTIKDWDIISKYLNNGEIDPETVNINNADVNEDGIISGQDLKHIRIYINGGSVATTTEVLSDGSTIINLLYTRNTYTLTLEEGEYIDSVTGTGTYIWGENVNIHATVHDPTEPDGYIYKWLGWESSDIGLLPNQSQQSTTIMMPKGDVTLTAKATRESNSATIVFDPAGGTVSPTKQVVICGLPYGELPTPTREGWTFDGWYLGAELITAETIVTLKVDHVLTAKWSKEIKLTYDANGGTGVPTEQTKTINSPETSYAFTISTTEPTKNGCVFNGWSTSSAATESLYSAGGTIILSDSITLYAVWKGALATYRVEHYLDKDLYKTEIQYAPAGTIIILADCVISEGDLRDASYIKGFIWCETHEVVDEACIKCGATGVILNIGEENVNGGIYGDVNADGIITYEDAELIQQGDMEGIFIENGDITKDGLMDVEDAMILMQYLAGIGLTGVTEATVLADGSLVIKLYYTTEDVELATLVYDKNTEDTVTNMPNPSTQTAALTGETYTFTISDSIPRRAGYEFVGWNTASNGTGTTYNSTISVGNETVTLYAQWEVEIVTYTVRHYLQNADNDNYTLYLSDIKEAETDETITLANEVSDEGDLAYANYLEGKVGTEVVTETEVKGNGRTIIKLYYTRATYNLVLKDESGALISDTTHRWGEKITIDANVEASVNPAYTNVWDRWVSSNVGLVPHQTDKNTVIVMPKGNVTLTATCKLVPKTYVVTFDATGGISYYATKNVTFDATYGDLPNAILDGYALNGWFTAPEGGTQIQPTTKVSVASNHTLYAQWTKLQGSVVPPAMVTYTVEHYLENADNTEYTLQTTETKTALANSTVILSNILSDTDDLIYATYKEGKVNDVVVTQTSVLEDGSLVIKLYYTRNQYKLELVLEDVVSQESTYKWGESITISATLMSSAAEGYVWDGWKSSDTTLVPDQENETTTIIMPKGNITLTATARIAYAEFTVKHYLASDSTWTLCKEETKEALAGSTITLADYVTNEGDLAEATYTWGSKLCSEHNDVGGTCSKCGLTGKTGIFNIGVEDANGNVCGDANGDGRITHEDYDLILSYDIGLSTIEVDNCDINGDGNVDTTDAKMVNQYLNGVITANAKVLVDGSLIISLYYEIVPAGYIAITYETLGRTQIVEAYNSSENNGIILLENIPEVEAGKSFRGWSTTEGATVAEYKPGAWVNWTTDKTLYPVSVTPLATGAAFTGADIGAYVMYAPIETSYTATTAQTNWTSSQTYNPAEVTSWRVFNKNGNKVEIISDESVGELWLRGGPGYKNAVKVLQDMSAAYINPGYAESARHLGYNDEGLDEEQKAQYNQITATLEAGLSGFPYGETRYLNDVNHILANSSLKSAETSTWLASRAVYTESSTMTKFQGRFFGLSGGTNTIVTLWSPAGLNYDSNGVRPIITLKEGLIVGGGDGSPNNPYVLVDSNNTLIIYDANGGTGAPAIQTVTPGSSVYLSETIPTAPVGKAFRGWATRSNATVADYKPGAYIENASNMTLYAVYVTPLASGASFTGADVGAYVTYTPSTSSTTVATTVSGYDSVQTFNPANTTSWRVFSKDGTNVEIIPDESAGYLIVQGETGYINYVQTLQTIATSYKNSAWAVSARALGYSEEGLTAAQITNYKTINTTTYPLELEVADGTFPYSDTQYTRDLGVLQNTGSLKIKDHENEYEWLASRNSQYVSQYPCTEYGIVAFKNTGEVTNNNILYWSDDGAEQVYYAGVRPVVKLQEGLTVASGDGSPSNPYVLTN